MSIHIDRNRPWLSLSILWLAFFCITWNVVYPVHDPTRLVTVTVVELGVALVISALYSVSWRSHQPLNHLLKDDMRSFATAVIGAFVAVLLLAWIEFTLAGLTLLVASSLAKVELRIAGIRTWRSFVVTGAVSCLAVLCAAGTHWGLLHGLPNHPHAAWAIAPLLS